MTDHHTTSSSSSVPYQSVPESDGPARLQQPLLVPSNAQQQPYAHATPLHALPSSANPAYSGGQPYYGQPAAQSYDHGQRPLPGQGGVVFGYPPHHQHQPYYPAGYAGVHMPDPSLTAPAKLSLCLNICCIIVAVVCLTTIGWLRVTTTDNKEVTVGLYRVCGSLEGDGDTRCGVICIDEYASDNYCGKVHAMRSLWITIIVFIFVACLFDCAQIFGVSMCGRAPKLASPALTVLAMILAIAAFCVAGEMKQDFQDFWDQLASGQSQGTWKFFFCLYIGVLGLFMHLANVISLGSLAWRTRNDPM